MGQAEFFMEQKDRWRGLLGSLHRWPVGILTDGNHYYYCRSLLWSVSSSLALRLACFLLSETESMLKLWVRQGASMG